MPAFADVVGKEWDGSLTVPTAATTPTTYTPTVIDQNGVANWSVDGAVYDANKRLSLSVKRPTKGSQVIRVVMKLAHPVMDADDDTLKIGESLVTIEAVYPKRATQAQRDTIMGHALFIAYESTPAIAAFSELKSTY
jgi:hypothetical protein